MIYNVFGGTLNPTVLYFAVSPFGPPPDNPKSATGY